MNRRRAVIAGGGTGGHFYPALVLAKTLRRRGWETLIAVRMDDPALPVLERESMPSAEIDLHGLPRAGGTGALIKAGASFGLKLARALDRSRRLLRDFDPDATVGMGGYLSFPLAAASALRGIPRAVHESNAVLGLANRACLSLGARLFWGLPPPPGAPGRLTGTPIRPELWSCPEPGPSRRELGLDPALPTLLAFGGSQGARGINRAVPDACAAAWRQGSRFQVLHLAGPREDPAVRSAYGKGQAVVFPYMERMDLAYGACDLVVCRSGASTLAELAALRKPAVLVPYPFAAARHQELNARLLESRGAARVALEDGGAVPGLAGALVDLLFSEGCASRRAAMAAAYESLALPAPARAAEELADAVETLVETHVEAKHPHRQ